MVFYILSFGWLLLRGIFWVLTLTSTTQWGAFMFYMLYWVPVPMEFGSFMLVPLYFAHLLYPAYGTYLLAHFLILTNLFCSSQGVEDVWSICSPNLYLCYISPHSLHDSLVCDVCRGAGDHYSCQLSYFP